VGKAVVDKEEQLNPTEYVGNQKDYDVEVEDDVEKEKTVREEMTGGSNMEQCKKREKSVAREFWAAKSKQLAKEERERKMRAKKPKTEKEWKFKTVEKPKITIKSVGTKVIGCLSPRDASGRLRLDIAIMRLQRLEHARIEEEQKLSQDLEKIRLMRANSMKTLDRSDFVAAQDRVSRVLLKRPEDYELANNENTLKLQQGMKQIFRENLDNLTLSEDKEEKFIEILELAGILVSSTAESPKSLMGEKTEGKPSIENNDLELLQPLESPSVIQVERKKPWVFKEINMNASQFLRTANEKDKKVFVDTVCQLFERKPTLEEVKFNYGALNEDNVVKIAESLEKCESLQAVYLDSNDFGNKGVKALIKLLNTHKDTLTTLSMQNLPVWQQISTELLCELVEAIERSTALVKLGFDLKQFRHSEYKDRVSKALKRNAETARLFRVKKKFYKSMDI